MPEINIDETIPKVVIPEDYKMSQADEDFLVDWNNHIVDWLEASEIKDHPPTPLDIHEFLLSFILDVDTIDLGKPTPYHYLEDKGPGDVRSKQLGELVRMYVLNDILYEFECFELVIKLNTLVIVLLHSMREASTGEWLKEGAKEMGVNMPPNTTGEGDAFVNAMSFHSKDKSTDEQIKPLPESTGEYQKYLDGAIVPTGKISGRPSKDEYYLKMAEDASLRGTCIRRKFGCVIVKNDEIISTGYVGAPRGRQNCIDIGSCWREQHNIPSGQMYEKCRSVHAEMNAIISAKRSDMIGASMYLVGVENDGSYTESDCCSMCKRVIINAGIDKVIFRKRNGNIRVQNVQEWINNDDSLIEHEGY